MRVCRLCGESDIDQRYFSIVIAPTENGSRRKFIICKRCFGQIKKEKSHAIYLCKNCGDVWKFKRQNGHNEQNWIEKCPMCNRKKH